MEQALLICTLIFGMNGHDINQYDKQGNLTFDNCMYITAQAENRGYDGSVIASLVYYESRFETQVKHPDTDATGLLQAIASWHCPKRTWVGCDPVEAGFRAVYKSYKYTKVGRYYRESTLDRVFHIDSSKKLLKVAIGWFTGVKDSKNYGHVNSIVGLAFKVRRLFVEYFNCRCSI